MKKARTRCRSPRLQSTAQCLEPAHQEQYQQDHDNQAKAAAAIVSRAIERTATDAAEAAEQGEHEYDQNDSPDRHLAISSSPAVSNCCSAIERKKRAGTHKVPFSGSIFRRAKSAAAFFSNHLELHALGSRSGYLDVGTSRGFHPPSPWARRSDPPP